MQPASFDLRLTYVVQTARRDVRCSSQPLIGIQGEHISCSACSIRFLAAIAKTSILSVKIKTMAFPVSVLHNAYYRVSINNISPCLTAAAAADSAVSGITGKMHFFFFVRPSVRFSSLPLSLPPIIRGVSAAVSPQLITISDRPPQQPVYLPTPAPPPEIKARSVCGGRAGELLQPLG